MTGFEWSIQTELANLVGILVGGIVISVLIALLLGFWLSRRALRPVAAMTEAARRIGSANLQDRLPTEFRVSDELTQLAETFNGLLDRLSASFEREKRFTSNAAHELLTPLSTMKNEVEVTLRRSRSPEEYRECLNGVLEDADRLVGTAAGLLKLARAGAAEFVTERTVDLSVLVETVARRYATRMDDAGIQFTWSAPPGVRVIGDQNALMEVVENLLENALRYTPREGRVFVRLLRSGDQAVLEVEDSGIGFPPDEAHQLFDQFFRGSGARERARHGSGVGLAIVRTLVERLGGTVAAQSDGLGQGSLFRVTLRPSG